MSKAAEEYEKLAALFSGSDGVVPGQMFGKACLKINGKAFIAQQKDWVVFKLSGALHEKALSVKGAALWDPSGKGRPMKEWVAIPGSESTSFNTFATAALNYVADQSER